VENLKFIESLELKRVGIRMVANLFGTAVAFSKLKRH
jgi:hypothetical protein